MTASITIDGVGVRLGGADVITELSLQLEPGSWTMIIGPNGAGKSSLLRCIAGLLDHDGSIDIGAASLSSPRERARVVGYLPQTLVVPPAMSLFDYVLLGRTPHLGAFAAPGSHDLDRVREVLGVLDLESLGQRTMGSLSGGEAQRAGLARALVQDTPVLLLDEPTAALDLGHQQEVLRIVEDIRSTREVTVVMTVHDLTVAGRCGADMVLLDGGRIVAQGAAADVLTPDLLERHYGARVRIIHDDEGPIIVPVTASHRGPT